MNDQQVTTEATFIPAESNGTVDVLFTFDATELEGTSVVVFETLFQGETEISSHEDMEDEGQTITFTEQPRIGTTATVDGQHTAEPTGEITIVDVVAYSGLDPRRDLQDVRCPDGQGHWGALCWWAKSSPGNC